ncbi:DUF222 domain-containing protein [Arthrobacter gandavensis]|uniref:HNH endonuclease n=1 Tax=Arthrobacter gandavensis TaxID=169960 RepID=UPI00189039E5|nr:HNH endonuclease signature motif containing protein [Arthrobacter gandavensis]MBF4993597.1 DUF222 domain-containing protein [Arthrobacter gandavensis]
MFHADPAQAETTSPGSLPEGFTGQLCLRSPETLGYDETVSTLQRLGMLISWAQAQQARVAARLEVLFARDITQASGGREEPALAMSLAAAEASTALNIPHMSAMQLISESTRLCSETPQTLARLSEGKIALQHARIILDETHHLPADVLTAPDLRADAAADPSAKRVADPEASSQNPGRHSQESGQLDLGLNGLGSEPADEAADTEASDTAQADGQGTAGIAGALDETESLTVRGAFERDLLAAAEGRTAAGFGRRARRQRETRFPDLIPVRHRQAKDKRRVSFQPLPDGMSCLSAVIAAEKGQAMFAALTGAAKAGKHAGDPRTMDQLRADTLTELLLENQPPTNMRTAHATTPTPGMREAPDGGPAGSTQPDKRPRRAERHRNQNQNQNRSRSRSRSRVRTEVMVLINADTLAGLDENPAELNGYGPISADTARTMILNALHWTPLLQNPATGEILTVGRTRRIPAGLKRWLQARDGTCRFPGCSVNVTHAEIDHTTPYSRGGPTDHANLEHLCPKHHRFKTLGHWKARQPEPGTIEWNSPAGRTYATDPALDYLPTPPKPGTPQSRQQPGTPQPPGRSTPKPDDDPPPF